MGKIRKFYCIRKSAPNDERLVFQGQLNLFLKSDCTMMGIMQITSDRIFFSNSVTHFLQLYFMILIVVLYNYLLCNQINPNNVYKWYQIQMIKD